MIGSVFGRLCYRKFGEHFLKLYGQLIGLSPLRKGWKLELTTHETWTFASKGVQVS